MPMCDAIIVSTISRMLHAVAAVVITILYVRWWLSMLVLRLKAAESFRDKNPDYEMWKKQILSGIAKAPG